MKLVKPSQITEREYYALIDEIKAANEEFVPWALDLQDRSFDEYVKYLNDQEADIGVKEGWVPTSTRFLQDDDGKPHGAVNIRHRLTDRLRTEGGHIGYGIRPGSRKKGYGTLQLKLALEIVKGMGITEVLVTCGKDNPGSAGVIRNNGGVLENEVEVEDRIVQRYWVVTIKVD